MSRRLVGLEKSPTPSDDDEPTEAPDVSLWHDLLS